MNRRAQGISVNVIIIAAIALVVMVILIALVLNTGSDLNRGVSACENWEDGVEGQDYQCIDPDFEACGDYDMRRAPPNRACAGSTEEAPQICCVDLI